MPTISETATRITPFMTMEGTPNEVREKLTGSPATRVIAMAFTPENEQDADAIAEVLAGMGSLIPELIAKHQQAALFQVISALVPSTPLPGNLLTEARMTAHAREGVLNSADWLTSAQIAEQAGFSDANRSAQPSKWKKDGLIFAINNRNVDYFPGYGLDRSTFRPLKALAPVLAAFQGEKDSWGLAYWFSSVNSYLGGRRPQDLLLTAPAEVLAAAKDEMAGVAHG